MLLHGEERKQNKFIPKVINLAIKQIQSLSDQSIDLENVKAVFGPNVDQKLKAQAEEIRTKVNQGDWNSICNCQDPVLLVFVIIELLRSLKPQIIEEEHIKQIRVGFTQLDNLVLALLSNLSELISFLACKGTFAQTDDISRKFTDVLIQGSHDFFNDIHTSLNYLPKLIEEQRNQEITLSAPQKFGESEKRPLLLFDRSSVSPIQIKMHLNLKS